MAERQLSEDVRLRDIKISRHGPHGLPLFHKGVLKLNFLKSILAWVLKRILPSQRRDNKIIEAVHEDDIEDILQKLGLLESLKNGELHCESCNCVINKENIQSFFSYDGKIGFCCENFVCYEKLIEKIKGE